MMARMDATRIILIRHGETAWNASTRIQGHTDIALNERGLLQAQCVAQALAQREPLAAIDHCYRLPGTRRLVASTGQHLGPDLRRVLTAWVVIGNHNQICGRCRRLRFGP